MFLKHFLHAGFLLSAYKTIQSKAIRIIQALQSKSLKSKFVEPFKVLKQM